MIPSVADSAACMKAVYQRGLVIDSQLCRGQRVEGVSISKGIGD